MNIESFRNSRRRSANLAADMPFMAAPDAPGWIYAGDLFIEDNGATACLTIGAESWAMPSRLIGDLEAVLYQWALGGGTTGKTRKKNSAPARKQPRPSPNGRGRTAWGKLSRSP